MALKKLKSSPRERKKEPGRRPNLVVRGPGGIKISVWQNEHDGDLGKFTSYSCKVERGYKDDKDKWQETNSFRFGDLLNLAEILKSVWQQINMIEHDSASSESADQHQEGESENESESETPENADVDVEDSAGDYENS